MLLCTVGHIWHLMIVHAYNPTALEPVALVKWCHMVPYLAYGMSDSVMHRVPTGCWLPCSTHIHVQWHMKIIVSWTVQSVLWVPIQKTKKADRYWTVIEWKLSGAICSMFFSIPFLFHPLPRGDHSCKVAYHWNGQLCCKTIVDCKPVSYSGVAGIPQPACVVVEFVPFTSEGSLAIPLLLALVPSSSTSLVTVGVW